MDEFRVNKSDRSIFLSLIIILLTDILFLVYSIIAVNTKIYFICELLFFTILPVIILYSLVLSIINKFKQYYGKSSVFIKPAVIILYLCFVLFNKSYLLNMYLDIPNLISGNYRMVEGKPRNISIEGTKIRSQFFEVNKIKFDIKTYLYNKHIRSYERYKILYLQNSKYIIRIEKI
ncbi:hypothetical protein PDUR_08445 [Paenibacillus durus]|uniref:Uncharacterized protein n=1 Tax=Paenibacillus durus TaxID=44251 RepID=A0A089HNN1_PAEDU|nr:hypothetical protein PDUR_08445 [Paenibacillus durus]